MSGNLKEPTLTTELLEKSAPVSIPLHAADLEQQAGVKRKRSPDGESVSPNVALRLALTDCVKDADFSRAFGLYEEFIMAGVSPTAHVYSLLLNIASRAVTVPPHVVRDALKVFDDMRARGTPLNEATYSSLVRICALGGDVDKARGLIREMVAANIAPRLRTFSPVIIALAAGGKSAAATAVLEEVRSHALPLSQVEYGALIRAYALDGDMQGAELRVAAIVDEVEIVDDQLETELSAFFSGAMESERLAGVTTCAAPGRAPASIPGSSTNAVVPEQPATPPFNWPWACAHGSVSSTTGICSVTGRTLRSIDICGSERDALMEQCMSLVGTHKNQNSLFKAFRDWLARRGPFDVIVDGANVGFANQNFKEGAFSYSQIDAVVRDFQARGLKVLIVLHSRWLQQHALASGDSRRAAKSRINYYAARNRGEVDPVTGRLLVRPGTRAASTTAGGITGVAAAEMGPEDSPTPRPQVWRPSACTAAPFAASAGRDWSEAGSQGSEEREGDSDSYDSGEERGDFVSEEGEGKEEDIAGVEAEFGKTGTDENVAPNPFIACDSEHDTRMAPSIVARWHAEDLIFSIPVGFNDDWFWLYAAFHSQSMKERAPTGSSGAASSSSTSSSVQPVLMVTNDLMRDHHFQMLHVQQLLTFRDRHQVYYRVPAWYDKRTGRRFHHLELRFPLPYSHVVQEAEDGSTWHFPCAAPVVNGPGITPGIAARSHNQWLVAFKKAAFPTVPVHAPSSFRAKGGISGTSVDPVASLPQLGADEPAAKRRALGAIERMV